MEESMRKGQPQKQKFQLKKLSGLLVLLANCALILLFEISMANTDQQQQLNYIFNPDLPAAAHFAYEKIIG